jgi:nicotinate phosphoribosyltransferase
LGNSEVLIVDPSNPLRQKKLTSLRRIELLQPIVSAGEMVYEFPSLDEITNHRKDQLGHLHESYKRLNNPHEYKVGLTQELWQQKQELIHRFVSQQSSKE